jgi:hypothetical protein
MAAAFDDDDQARAGVRRGAAPLRRATAWNSRGAPPPPATTKLAVRMGAV